MLPTTDAVPQALPTTADELLASITDPTEPPDPTWYDRIIDRAVRPYLVDERDVVFTRLATRALGLLVPASVGLYLLPGWWAMALLVPYVVLVFVKFAAPVMLALHAVTHRPLFRRPVRGLRRIWTHWLPLYIGVTPFAYKAHHVFMHHTENNGDDDLSGTAEYRRDNVKHFAHYWLRFLLFGYWHMASWMRRRDRKGLALVLLGDAACYALAIGLLFWKPAATLVVFIIPYFMMRYFMMAGNWTEHSFVDVDQPTNSYRNSMNLINTRFNHRCFNAGYHLVHHIVPGRHWADTPDAFAKYLPRMIEEDAILFYGVPSNQTIWWKLMTGNYDYLAERLLDLGNRRPTHEEKVAFLKQRARGQRGRIKGLLERREGLGPAPNLRRERAATA